jgi:hypothetical protein
MEERFRASSLQVSSCEDLLHIERERCDPERELGRAYPSSCWPYVADVGVFLSSITRSASHDQKTLTLVQLVTLEDGSREDPIFTTIFAGHLKYLGQEQLSLAGRKWYADKFELKVAAHPPFLAWTSPEGLLLAFAPENKNKTLAHDGTELVRFQQSNDF